MLARRARWLDTLDTHGAIRDELLEGPALWLCLASPPSLLELDARELLGG